MYFEKACIFAKFPLDPCDSVRKDVEVLKSLKQDPSSRLILFSHGEIIMKSVDDAYYAKVDENVETVFLGKDEKHAYFASEAVSDFNLPSDCEVIDLRTIARHAADHGFSSLPSLLARGKMLLDWHDRHEFCAKCGDKSNMKRGGYMRHCQSCETEHFPRVDPVVIMMVTMGDKCLLGRSPHFQPGMFSALAGFMEPGETIEEACRREVLEEAGIKVGNVRYVKSQPWPFPSSLMIGVIAEALTEEITIDKNELEEARWFTKKEVQSVLESGGDDHLRIPEKLTIARHILDVHLYEEWLRNKN
ncbi:MAG: NAD(+) diphosphatase [Emcibacteraceae bacterium]|nr:NAD(+) diphosphatase [Emcibacteraceae bacterium]